MSSAFKKKTKIPNYKRLRWCEFAFPRMWIVTVRLLLSGVILRIKHTSTNHKSLRTSKKKFVETLLNLCKHAMENFMKRMNIYCDDQCGYLVDILFYIQSPCLKFKIILEYYWCSNIKCLIKKIKMSIHFCILIFIFTSSWSKIGNK